MSAHKRKRSRPKPTTIEERKKAIGRPWRALYSGRCFLCKNQISVGSLVCCLKSSVIHYSCHPDWVPAPFPGYTYSGRKKGGDNA